MNPYLELKERDLEGREMKYRMILTIGDQKDLIHARRFLVRKKYRLPVSPPIWRSNTMVTLATTATPHRPSHTGSSQPSSRTIPNPGHAMYTRHEHWDEVETDANKQAISEALEKGLKDYEKALDQGFSKIT